MELILEAVLMGSTFLMVSGHGRMIEPPGRSSMWRYGFNTPINTNDHQLSCGGFGVQFYRNGGKCGICGDRYDGVRDNEAGGLYATGIISRTYRPADVMTVKIEITVNHGGWFEFRICPNNDVKKPATQACLDKFLLRQVNGGTRITFPEGPGIFPIQLQLPKDLTCTQCVLQWKWNTASNVACEGSSCCRGCGPQEQFYGCSDISIQENINVPYRPYVDTKPHTTEKPVTLNPNSNGIAPSVFLPIGVNVDKPQAPDMGNIKECKATKEYQLQIPLADQWCQMNCQYRNQCPKALCEDSCRLIFEQDCKAKPFWRAMFSDPSTGDKWCSQQCAEGPCPLQYCEKECWKR